MGYRPWYMWLVCFCCLGCAHYSKEEKNVYVQGYSSGVKEQMNSIAREFQGGKFPYYYWSAPMVQEVNVPGHIANGVFIPAHKELVIIKPGEWAQSPAYPITTQGETYVENKENMGINAVDITYLPNGNGVSSIVESGRKESDSSAAVGSK